MQETSASKEDREQHLQQVVTFVEQHSGALMVDKLDTQLHFKVPTDCEAKLSAFFQQVKVCFEGPGANAADNMHTVATNKLD